jgi:hypothetical protein
LSRAVRRKKRSRRKATKRTVGPGEDSKASEPHYISRLVTHTTDSELASFGFLIPELLMEEQGLKPAALLFTVKRYTNLGLRGWFMFGIIQRIYTRLECVLYEQRAKRRQRGVSSDDHDLLLSRPCPKTPPSSLRSLSSTVRCLQPSPSSLTTR